jgi:hypothetical protein
VPEVLKGRRNRWTHSRFDLGLADAVLMYVEIDECSVEILT